MTLPLGKDPQVEVYESSAEGLGLLVEKLKEITSEGSETFAYIIQGERWNITQGPNRYLINGDTKVPLFDEATPEIQEDGFLGDVASSELLEETQSEMSPVGAIAPTEASFSDDDYFENEPDYDESLDDEGA